MIAKATQRELEALAELEHLPRFKDIVKWLQRSLDETKDRCISERDTDEVRRLQGAGSDLKEILETATKARSYLQNSKR